MGGDTKVWCLAHVACTRPGRRGKKGRVAQRANQNYWVSAWVHYRRWCVWCAQ